MAYYRPSYRSSELPKATLLSRVFQRPFFYTTSDMGPSLTGPLSTQDSWELSLSLCTTVIFSTFLPTLNCKSPLGTETHIIIVSTLKTKPKTLHCFLNNGAN